MFFICFSSLPILIVAGSWLAYFLLMILPRFVAVYWHNLHINWNHPY
jgi:hypothetical protein